MIRLLHVHFAHRYVFNGVADQEAKCAKAKNDKENIVFKGLNF